MSNGFAGLKGEVATVAVYSRANPALGEWKAAELTPWAGTLSAVEGVTLDFSIGGTVQGSEGCGPFTADYSIDDGVLTLADERIAAIGCPDVRGDLSTKFWDILLDNPTLGRDGGVLVLESLAGTLTRT